MRRALRELVEITGDLLAALAPGLIAAAALLGLAAVIAADAFF